MSLMGLSVDWIQLKENISDLEGICIESSHTKNQGTKTTKNPEHNIQGMWDNCKRCKDIMGIPEEEEKEKGTEEIIETMTFPPRYHQIPKRSRKLKETRQDKCHKTKQNLYLGIFKSQTVKR